MSISGFHKFLNIGAGRGAEDKEVKFITRLGTASDKDALLSPPR